MTKQYVKISELLDWIEENCSINQDNSKSIIMEDFIQWLYDSTKEQMEIDETDEVIKMNLEHINEMIALFENNNDPEPEDLERVKSLRFAKKIMEY